MSASHLPPPALPPLRRRLLGGLATALMVALVALLMEVVTEASLISEVFRHMAARMFVPYNGYFYGRAPEALAASDRLLVVDLGQPTLQRLRATWPISYGQHARLLERIRQGRPKALFIDFQFQAAREDATLAQLQATLCAFKADGIPLFLAAGSEAGEGRLRPELEALRDPQGQPCFDKVAVAYQPSEIDRIAWSYPLLGEVGGQSLPSAALALARTLRSEELVEAGSHATMGLVWGGGQRETGPRWQATPAEAAHGETPADAPGHYCRAPALDDIVPLQAFVRRITGFQVDPRPNCPMQASIEAAQLTAPKTADEAEALAALLRDRAVLYGGSFDANDFVTSPLQGDIPGVYLHAQATDNLLRFGTHWRHPDIGGHWGHAGELPMTFVALFAVALAFVGGRGLLRMLGRGLRRPPAVGRALSAWQQARTRGRQLLRRRWGALPARALGSLAELLGKLGLFYLSLLMAVPLSLALEHFWQVSVIGYASVLAFCLMGEVFSATHEADEALEERSGHAHAHPHPQPPTPENPSP